MNRLNNSRNFSGSAPITDFEWLIVQIFYNGLTYATKFNVNVVVGGALNGKSTKEAQLLVQEIAANSYQ